MKNKVSKEILSNLAAKSLHVQYCAHTPNLIVTDNLKDVHQSIAKLRNLRSSLTRFEKFKTFVNIVSLVSTKMLCVDVKKIKIKKAYDVMGDNYIQYACYFDEDERSGRSG